MGFNFNITTLILVLIMSEIITCAISDSAKDMDDCTEQLTGMATCLPYVQGEAKSPTPDCCSGLKQVLKDNKKCLCVIILKRNDPNLALNINVTLALGLPSVCNAPANVSQCPALLHLAPNSTEAQVFYQFGSSSNHTASIPAPSAEGNYTSKSDRQSGTVKGEGWSSRKKWVGLEFVVSVGVFLWFYNSPLFI